MAAKKILLFIVEGQTDETCLSTVLSRIFSSSQVQFQIVHGDILVQDFPSSDKIIAGVHKQISNFCGTIYRKSDICKVVHLADMDGVFIPDEAVVEHHGLPAEEYPKYTEEQIQTPNPQGIVRRNHCKRQNINRLSTVGKISGIPYSFYYFSSNLDHVLHGETNLMDWQKIELAKEFDLKYADDPNAFIRFMKESSFSVMGPYSETWAFIKAELHSLERYSNFGNFLPDQCEWGK